MTFESNELMIKKPCEERSRTLDLCHVVPRPYHPLPVLNLNLKLNQKDADRGSDTPVA